MKYLVCNYTGKEFNDVENRSGSITSHLKNIGIDIPSSYIRRKYKKEKGVFWHDQFFETKEKEIQIKKCKYCDWNTFDIENKSGAYTSHLNNSHNIDIESYIKNFPKEKILFKTFVNKEKHKNETLKIDNYIKCKICNKKLRYITNTHLKSHGLTSEEYKLKYGVDKIASKEFKRKSRKVLDKARGKIKNSFVSKPEKDLKSFIKDDLKVCFLSNNRSFFDGKEIDIIIPDHKICIEFNGNLYHSENYGGKKRYYHLEKTENCREKGYKLIHIFEDEWFTKNEIVKSSIKNILKLNEENKIYARKCEIKDISSNEKNSFLEKFHIQGKDRSDIKLGAFYKGNLVSVCTFSNKRNMVSKKVSNCFELRRFASDRNYRVIGIFSKFLSHFKKNFGKSEIITFLDIRWNSDKENNVYINNGFKEIGVLKTDYTYYNSKINRYKRFHKFNFGKKSLKRKFPETYLDSKTEWEIMQELGYDRIWDCGKIKYQIKF